MSISNAETKPSPESTYIAGRNRTADKLAREVFLISVGSAALPVVAAAIIMWQGGHGLPSVVKHAPSAQKATARSVAPQVADSHAAFGSTAKVAAAQDTQIDNSATPSSAPIASSSLSAKEDTATTASAHSAPVTEFPHLHSQPLANSADVIGRIQAQESGSGILQRNAPLSLPLVSIPETSPIRGTQAVAVEEPSGEPRTTASTSNSAKKNRTEVHTRAIAHHRHRPQKHLPPSLLAKIGQSVKKGLMNIAKFPRQAMERRSWD